MQAVSVSPERSASARVLSIYSANRHCALPIDAVIEVLRPLPLQTLADSPPFLLGLAVVRGAGIPVLDLARLLDDASEPHARWVHLRVGARRLALAVRQVGQVQDLSQLDWQPLPPLFDGSAATAVAQLAERDRELYLQLQVMRLLPEAIWQRIDSIS